MPLCLALGPFTDQWRELPLQRLSAPLAASLKHPNIPGWAGLCPSARISPLSSPPASPPASSSPPSAGGVLPPAPSPCASGGGGWGVAGGGGALAGGGEGEGEGGGGGDWPACEGRGWGQGVRVSGRETHRMSSCPYELCAVAAHNLLAGGGGGEGLVLLPAPPTFLCGHAFKSGGLWFCAAQLCLVPSRRHINPHHVFVCAVGLQHTWRRGRG